MNVAACKAGAACMGIASASLIADRAGALYWPEERLLAVADLHLEKGSSFALRGMMLPPYDTPDTLARLAAVVRHYAPRSIVTLGDNFHDRRGAERLGARDRTALKALMAGRDWIWIAGNHDPDPFAELGGIFASMVTVGPLTFRHEPTVEAPAGEIAGHLHPVAVVGWRGRGLRRRCFAGDGRRVVMPAFGAYAGGLNVRHRAFGGLFGADAFTAHVIGDAAVYPIAAAYCLPDGA